VLQGEHREQQDVDDERLADRPHRPRVDRLWHDETGDEADGIEKRAEEHRIGHGTESERENAPYCMAGASLGAGVLRSKRLHGCLLDWRKAAT
jgi:hypothetical protein